MTTVSDTAAVRRRHVVLTDVDEVTALVSAEYVEHVPVVVGDRDAFRFQLDSTQVASGSGSFRLDWVRHTLGGRAETEPAPDLLLTMPRSGRLRRVVGQEETTSACLVPYWTSSVAEWDDLGAVFAVLDLDGVRRIGTEISGIDPDEVEFSGWQPLSPSMVRYLDAVIGHLDRSVLADDAVLASPLVRAGAFRQLAIALLAAFPNTTQTLAAGTDDDHAAPATVRRAVEFMDAHAREEIDIVRIAEAARIGPRGLQAAFRKHRGQTPLEYLRTVRMEGAHRELTAGDPTLGDTVAAIAAGWGFAHPGRFSVEYQRAYGHPPSETLRR